MSYGDTVIRRVNDLVDDEYQERIVHQASTVGMQCQTWALLLVAVALAWILPGGYSWFSFPVVLIPVVAGDAGSLIWSKRYAPRPRYRTSSIVEGVFIAVAILAVLLGVVVNGADGDAFALIPALILWAGAAVAGMLNARRLTLRRRARDAAPNVGHLAIAPW